MLVLPIPMIVCLLLTFLLVKALLTRRQSQALLVLLSLCAWQSLLIALVRYYGFTALLPLQPLFASIIPPVAWLAFSSTRRQPGLHKSDLWHLAGPVIVVLCLLVASDLVDVAIPVLYVAYGIAILLVARKGGENMPEVRLESGEIPARLWQLFAVTLIASALSDVIIVALQILGYGEWQPLVISLFSSLNLLLIGVISLSRELSQHENKTDEYESEPKSAVIPSQINDQQDQAIVDQLQTLLTEQALYLDPDLTLAKLARKLSVPAKQLSAAVNRSQGENISRYINGFRIEHACGLLAEGKSITATVFESGFNTRSNFNREFLRLKGVSPRDWVGAI